MQAAITLGHLGATGSAPALAARLLKEEGRVLEAVVAALEMLRDRNVLPDLVGAMRRANIDQVPAVAHALAVLSGVDLALEPRATSEHVRQAWLEVARKNQLASVPPARVANVRQEKTGLVTFDVQFGRGNLQIGFDPPEPGATWPRWGRSVFVRGERVVDVGSTCGTCESLLRFVSWPAQDVSALANGLEDRRGELTLEAWVTSWEPLLRELRGGRYVGADLSLRVERIDPARRRESWFVRRYELRVDDEEESAGPEAAEDADLAWPGMIHYQGARAGAVPTFPVVIPLSDPANLDSQVVEAFATRIVSGDQPPVVAFAWLDEREVEARWMERFLYLAVLNGHHRLEAYARAGVPARIIAFGRIDDSWGPPEDPAEFLRESFAAFRGS